MGFRDLKCFNFSLLVKQAWRVLKNEEFLLHQVYKAKYFPHCSFFESKLGFNPSYAWKGIWEARKILLKGYQLRIGNGNTARIWEDTWVPGHQALKNEMILYEGTNMSVKVASLIDRHMRWWDVQ